MIAPDTRFCETIVYTTYCAEKYRVCYDYGGATKQRSWITMDKIIHVNASLDSGRISEIEIYPAIGACAPHILTYNSPGPNEIIILITESRSRARGGAALNLGRSPKSITGITSLEPRILSLSNVGRPCSLLFGYNLLWFIAPRGHFSRDHFTGKEKFKLYNLLKQPFACNWLLCGNDFLYQTKKIPKLRSRLTSSIAETVSFIQ